MSLRWEDERYVRLYTRDTVGWKMLPWQSKALLPLLMRKVDRAGLLDLGEHGADGLAAIVELPLEVVEVGLAELLRKKTAEMRGSVLVLPNFIDAQEAVSSDAQRKRDQRERARSIARYEVLSGEVTKGEETGQTVTKRDFESQNRTESHAQSREVTSGHSVPIRAVPSVPTQPSDARARVWGKGWFSEIWTEVTRTQPSGNWTLLDTVAEKIARSAAQREREPAEWARALLDNYRRYRDERKAAGKTPPHMRVESFDQAFGTCEEIADGADPASFVGAPAAQARPPEPSGRLPEFRPGEYGDEPDNGPPPTPEEFERSRQAMLSKLGGRS